jgi:hypothetical protein
MNVWINNKKYSKIKIRSKGLLIIYNIKIEKIIIKIKKLKIRAVQKMKLKRIK